MKVEVKKTNDGSNTLFVPELNEHYHSIHGALQEALHVFIKHGLQPVLENATEPMMAPATASVCTVKGCSPLLASSTAAMAAAEPPPMPL